MTLPEINEQISIAQGQYELSVLNAIKSTERKETAQHEMIAAESEFRKSRLELQLYTNKLKSLMEQSYNTRQEMKGMR